jgi:hypothetical protein
LEVLLATTGALELQVGFLNAGFFLKEATQIWRKLAVH